MTKKIVMILGGVLYFLLAFTSCQRYPSEPGVVTQGAEKDGLALELKLDKTVLTVSENITATIRLKNVASDGRTIVVLKWFKHWAVLDYVIKDSSGKRVNPNDNYISVQFPKPLDFTTLRKGEVIESSVKINSVSFPVKPGEYTIQVIYNNRSDPDPEDYTNPDDAIPAWKGELLSNVITVTVKP
jgi:hypothetical protein